MQRAALSKIVLSGCLKHSLLLTAFSYICTKPEQKGISNYSRCSVGCEQFWEQGWLPPFTCGSEGLRWLHSLCKASFTIILSKCHLSIPLPFPNLLLLGSSNFSKWKIHYSSSSDQNFRVLLDSSLSLTSDPLGNPLTIARI